jgi:hypothetical protein
MSRPQPSIGRTLWAIAAGFLTVVILSTAADLLCKVAGLLPADGSRPSDGLFVLFLAYRLVFTILSGYLTARLAPEQPMKHALILGSVGMTVAVVGALAMGSYGPGWYNGALILTALPLTLLGAKLRTA